MFSKKLEEVGNPLIYIFLTIATSSIVYGIDEEFRRLMIIIVAFFFLCMIYYCGIKFSAFMILFFALGLMFNINYYNVSNKVNESELRIVKVGYNVVGKCDGKNLIIKTNKKDFNVGERYRISGSIVKNQDRINGIVGEITTTKFYKINGDIITKLYEIKRNIYLKLEENLGVRKAGLLSSIAFGYIDYLDSEDKDNMNNLGIIHSISVSGLHVAIIYGFLRLFMGNKFGILITFIYVLFTGSNYSSIRSFLMLACIESGKILKRNNNSLSALCFSAVFLVIYEPYSIFNISFHLSYLATLGIILYNKKSNDLLYKLNVKIRESLSLTLSAQIFALPYLILVFKDFSINFIMGNLVLVPFIDLMVITGNILVLTYPFQILFDFFSYINLKIIDLFDLIFNYIDEISFPMMYGNEYVAFFYLFLLISGYFVKKGYKKFIYLPLISIFIIAIQIYSPIPNIKYYREGAFLLSYKGERILIANKDKIDLKSLSKSAFATKSIRSEKGFVLKDIGKISIIGKKYILETHKKKYLLKIKDDKNQYGEYDIINFNNKINYNIFIFNGEVL